MASAQAVHSTPAPAQTPAWKPRALRAGRSVAPYWPVVVAAAFLLALVLLQVHRIKEREGGKFIYPIDDVYMHLAVARNLVGHGSWAVSYLNGFCNCMSSLIWPWIIAPCFLLFGNHEYYPVILNVIAAIGALAYAGGMLRRTIGAGLPGAVILCGIVFLTPMTVVVLLGMEHSLQILVSLLFADLASRLLTWDEHALRGARPEAALCAASALLVTTRYEGLFMVAAAGLLLVLQRRWKLAFALGASAAAPLALFGLIAVSKGWAFFPTSLLLKGNTKPVMTLAGLGAYFSKGYLLLLQEKHFLMTVVALTAALIASLQKRWTLWSYSTLLLFITFLTAIQHLQFASLGWFYRYEAYLIVLVLLGVGITVFESLPRRLGDYWLRGPGLAHAGALAVAALLLGAPLWKRAADSIPHTVKASYNIYEQQHQMGRFIRRYYNGRGLIANDIGAITYMADIKLVDTAGLATLEALRGRLNGTFDHPLLRKLSREHDAELVMVYDTWSDAYKGPLPEWVPIGRWTIQNNTVTGGSTVSFYAANQSLAPRLTSELQGFARDLPKDVIQDGSYVGRSSYVTGTHGAENGPDLTCYWTREQGKFDLYPVHGEAIGSGETTLTLSYLPTMPGQRIEIFFNGELVANEGVEPGTERRWKTTTVKARWKPGKNELFFVGHGNTFFSPGDTRELMFQILDPLQRMDAAGQVTRPGVPAGLP